MSAHATNLAQSTDETHFYAALGLRASYTLGMSQSLALRLALDGVTPLTVPTFRIDAEPVWSAPNLAGSLALALLFRMR